MQVKANISFVGKGGDGKKYRVAEGDEFKLPPGTDWLDKGLVSAVEAEALQEKPTVKKKKGSKK